MAIPDFVPIIGSGFDQLSNQQLQWANFSRGVEEANLARAAQAEQAQNNWLAQVAELNQRRDEQNFQRQMDADNYVRQLGLQREDTARKARERREDIDLSENRFKKQMEYGANYLASQEKIKREQLQAQGALRDQKLESGARQIAANYGTLQERATTFETAANRLQDEYYNTTAAHRELSIKPNKSPEELSRLRQMESRLKELPNLIKDVQSKAKQATKEFNSLKLQAGKGGFEVDPEGAISHPATDRTWNWKDVLQQAKANVDVPGTAAPEASTDLSSVLTQPNVLSPEMAGTAPWAGFTQGTGTTPPPEAAPATQTAPADLAPVPVGAARPTPVKIGRYTATPIEE